MGMDLSGHSPTAPEGKYFRASIWTWPPLVKIITTLCPEETSSCKYWLSNEGDGLNGEQALALAEALERKLRSGEVAFALCDPALVTAALCDPTLITASEIGAAITALFRSQGVIAEHEEPVIDEHFVAKFAAFVRASGGFSIW